VWITTNSREHTSDFASRVDFAKAQVSSYNYEQENNIW